MLDLREAWDGESERSAPQSGSNLAGKGDGRCLNRNGDRRGNPAGYGGERRVPGLASA